MRFCYINTANIYPHDIHLIDGLRALGHEVLEINERSGGWRKYGNIARRYKETDRRFDAVIVGFTCPHFVPLARLLTTHKIVFNGVSSQYEANVISRGGGKIGLLLSIKWWILDFISFHIPSQTLLESSAQVDFVNRFFLVPKKKLLKSWTGVDEKEFYLDRSVGKRKEFTVLFRGRFLPESGVDTVIRAAKILDGTGVRFLVIGHGFLHKVVDGLMSELKPANLEMITEKLPIDLLRRKMLECHISLGQMADHPRLDRTLPCKLFESLALGLPYLTGRNRAALELLTEGDTCACAIPGDPKDVALKILSLFKDQAALRKIGERGYELYRTRLTKERLAQEFLNEVFPRV